MVRRVCCLFLFLFPCCCLSNVPSIIVTTSRCHPFPACLLLQRLKEHNPWYGCSFFHAQSAVFDNIMRYVRVAIGYQGIYLFYIEKEEVRASMGVDARCGQWS